MWEILCYGSGWLWEAPASSCLQDPLGYQAHHSAVWGEGTLFWGGGAVRKHKLCCLPLASLHIPLPLTFPSLQPGLVNSIPRTFVFIPLPHISSFPLKLPPKGGAALTGLPPTAASLLTWTLRDCRWFDAALGTSQCPALSIPVPCQGTGLRETLTKSSVGSQCHKEPKSQP